MECAKTRVRGRSLTLLLCSALTSAGLIIVPTFVGATPPQVVKPSVEDVAIGAPAAPAANVDVVPAEQLDEAATEPGPETTPASPPPTPADSAPAQQSEVPSASDSAASAPPSSEPDLGNDPATTTAEPSEPAVSEPSDAAAPDENAPQPADLPPLADMPVGTQVMLLEPTDTKNFSSLGVSWVGDVPAEGLYVFVRVRDDATGSWTDWEKLGLAAVDLPNPDRSALRQGTDPWWFGGSDGVQVVMAIAPGIAVADAKVTLIDPKQVSQDSNVGAPQVGAAGADVAVPFVYSRAQWGADESKRTWDPQYAGTIKAATLHHTAGSNNYSAADVPSVMRSIYQYQAVTLGWGDIGYNVVVDKFGRAWEGRYGGLESTVIGAHAGGFNSMTFGLSMIGNYDQVGVPAVVQEKLAQLIAWKLQKYGVNPKSTTQLTSRSGSGTTAKYPDGTVVTLNTVFGHRDVGNTTCPGRYGYAILPSLRDRAAAIMAAYPLTWTTGMTRTLKVNTGGVPAYSTAETTSGTAGFLSSGEVVQARGELRNGRTYVSGTVSGWVSTRYLTENPDVVGNAYTTTSGVPVRLGPGPGYLGAGEIMVNTTVSVSGEEIDGWIHIVHGAYGGWIEKKWTTTNRPSGATVPSGVPRQTVAYRTQTSGIPVKSGPYDSAGTTTTLAAGQIVNASQYAVNGYVHLQYGFNGAWVKREYLGSNAAPTRVVTTTTGGVPLLAGPSSGYSQVGAVSSGVALSASNLSINGYTHVHYGQWGAWVPNTWIKAVGSDTPPLTRTGTTNTNGVPVYSASSGSSTVGVLSAGTSLGAATGQQNGRIYVAFGATGGWVDARWLVFNPTSTSTWYTTTNGIPAHLGPGSIYHSAGWLTEQRAVQVSTAAPVDGWVNIVYAGTGAWVPQKWLTRQPTAGTTFYTNTGGVPIKMGPGAAYSTIGYHGAAVAVAASTSAPVDGYVHVVFGNTGGYISAQWLMRNPTPVASKTTTTSGISVNLGPGPAYHRVGELSVNTVVQVGSIEKDGYIQIVFGSTGGWIDKRWLK